MEEEPMKNRIIESLKKYTKHDNIFLAKRGNKAILAALKILKGINGRGSLLVPDQGGWITYSQYAKKLRLGIKELKTDYGVVDLKLLKDGIKDASAIIYSNPAGYYAEQPVKEIYELCRKNNVLVILDISGCIGSDYYKGNCADIIVCSFGKWKPVNLGYGGFISVADNETSEKNKNLLESLEFDGKYCPELCKKLESLEKRHELFEKTNKKIKEELKSFNILHKAKNGVNVIVKFSGEGEKNRIISYCEKNKYEFVVCPKLIKVNEDAISIEVKRIE